MYLEMNKLMKNIGFIGARNFLKVHFFYFFKNSRELRESVEFVKCEYDEWKVNLSRHSSSPPCGNLVDGLPHDCHIETVAKQARVGPRTPVVLTMEDLFCLR